MSTRLKQLLCGTAALLSAMSGAFAQANAPSPAPAASAGPSGNNPISAPIAKTNAAVSAANAGASDNPSMMLVQASTAPAPAPSATPNTAPAIANAGIGTPDSAADPNAAGVREFQGDDVGQVLRLLARQSKINMVVSDQIPPNTTVTMRLEDVTPLQAIAIIVKAKGLFMDKIDNVYYIKTPAERTAEPTESDSFQFSYARAKDTAPLIASQLQSKDAPQVDERTNTMFYRETRSNIDNIRKLLTNVDKPTKQVMIEARLVEVNANPRQSYGINWSGVVGSASAAKTFNFGGSTLGTNTIVNAQNVTTNPDGTVTTTPRLDANGIPIQAVGVGSLPAAVNPPIDFLRNASNGLSAIGGQFAILSVPAMSLTMRMLNEDADAEFLANPRIVTADNQQAKIEITRNQPVPQLNFNEQTATAVFGGFQDKKFGNTLVVRPSVNKDSFVTLSVKPEISNKVGDSVFNFAGAQVASPVIDTRTLDSNVLIKSGDTLAIGGLLQDEQTKARSKVPVLGDIPIVGYFFQERLNARTKRNLLVFVTPTILDPHYGTGLEDQVTGLHHSGEEYADPNGWRNNAKGAVRIVPTSNRQLTAEYPKPGTPPAPARTESSRVRFMADAKDRDN